MGILFQMLDFYIPKYNVAVECQGRQHFDVNGGWRTTEFEEIKRRDVTKNDLVNSNGIKLLYFCNLKDKSVLDKSEISIYNDENTVFIVSDLLDKIIS